MPVATAFGVLAGVVQALGLIRWVFLVPYLSEVYLNPASSTSTKAAVEVVFQGFHRYAGAALGEHLGYMFAGSWVLLAALAMLRTPLFSRWVAYLGFASAAGILVGLLEPVGFGMAVLINALGFILFAIWLQYALLAAGIPALAKVAFVFAATLALSWGTAAVLRRLPGFALVIGTGRRARSRSPSLIHPALPLPD